ncbi:MAG: YgfZ/GcvT domain-containing protein, partial [Sulfitobacter sp.]
MNDRRILRITGRDATGFLQGLITNDIRKLDHGPIYAAILTPQGKF